MRRSSNSTRAHEAGLQRWWEPTKGSTSAGHWKPPPARNAIMSQAAGQVGDQERSGLGAALVMAAGECSSEEDDREQAGRHRRHKRKHRHKRKRRHGGGEGARPPEGTKEVEAAPSLARDREQRQSHGLEWMTLPTRRRPGSEKESEVSVGPSLSLWL